MVDQSINIRHIGVCAIYPVQAAVLIVLRETIFHGIFSVKNDAKIKIRNARGRFLLYLLKTGVGQNRTYARP